MMRLSGTTSYLGAMVTLAIHLMITMIVLCPTVAVQTLQPFSTNLSNRGIGRLRNLPKASISRVNGGGGSGGGGARFQRKDIYIAGFLALSGHDIEAPLGQGVMPAINLALKHLADTNYLRDYRLRLLHNDTECSASVGIKAFFDMMDKDPRKVMILGGSCSAVTDYIAKTSKHLRIPVLSYADTHPMFTRKSDPNFFRIVPSEDAFNAPRVKLLQSFNWTRVGTLYQNEPRFALAQNTLVSLLDSAGIVLTESQGFVNDLSQPLAKLVEKDVRIILASFNATWARRVFCEVFRTNLYGRHYQWIITGPRQDSWWREEDLSVNCSAYEILAALEGAFVVDVLPLTSSKEKTISGLTAQEYESQYNQERDGQYSKFHGYAYDTIWAAAVTIKNVIHKLHERNRLGDRNLAGMPPPSPHQHGTKKRWSVHDFTYRDAGWEKLFFDAVRNVNFSGVTGQINFQDNERIGHLMIKQIVGAHEVQVAEYEDSSDTLFLNTKAISWMSKQPPKDRTFQKIELSRISIPVFATLTIVAAIGIILASTFLAVNIRFRNQRYIKMSSPYLNNTIIIGCLLTYTSVILLGLDSSLTSEAVLPMICTARIWTLMAGFTLAFGSMFSKTWRVYSIFTNVKLNKKAIKDYQLFMVVGVLLSIDIAILTTWQIIDPFFRETKLLDPYMHPSEDNIEIRPQNEYCASHHMTIFVGSIYAYKGLLMAFGCFLAWETRNVNIPALNDSKYIGMSVYNVVIMCVIGAAISTILSDQQDVSFVIISIFIIFCTTGTLCLVFVPKMIELRRNPQGTIEKRARPTVKPTLPKVKPSTTNENNVYHKSKARNTKLRKELRNLDDKIQRLLEQLGEDNDSIAKDGPSFSFKADSECRVPSVSGADTISLNSLVSSPEPTSNSPRHANRENGGNRSPITTQPGSETMTSSTVAMWTAISNPLLLISQVLRKSMELPEPEQKNLTLVPPVLQCEFIIEQHAVPQTELIFQRGIEDGVKETKNGENEEGNEKTQCEDQDSEGHFSVKGSPLNENGGYSEITCLSRCACHETRRRMFESFSLSKIAISQKYDNISIKPKSFSVQGALNDETTYTDPYSNSKSDSSLNYESNISEEKMFPSECCKYRSLESVNSNHTDCNSIQVNFDESSTFNSPKEEEMINTELKSSLFYQVSNQQTIKTSTNTNHSSSNCWSSDTLNGNADSVHLSHTPSVTSISSKSSQSRKKKKFLSTRQRKRKSKPKSNDTSSLNSVTQCSISNPDITRRKPSLNKTMKQDLTGNWSILPIFKQLIVQKHQGSRIVNDIPVDETRQMSSCPNLSIKCDVVEYF